MARRVGIFGAEGRPEGVNLAERHCHALALKLAGNGQSGGLSKEILRKIDSAILGERRVFRVKRCDAEHLAGALAVASRDQRRVRIDKSALVEKAVDSIRSHTSHAEYRFKGIGARTQMRDRT